MSKQSTSNPSTIATGTKVKDPRRVAAGKRLAAISRQAKEAKRSEREAQRNAGTTSSAYVQRTYIIYRRRITRGRSGVLLTIYKQGEGCSHVLRRQRRVRSRANS